MFEIDRTFCQRCEKTGLMEWYFNAREGIFGPYDTKKMATKELEVFVGRRKLSGDDGGRDGTTSDKLTLAPIADAKTEPVFFDFSKRKKGID